MKKRKVEEKVTEKNSLKRKLVQTIDFETDDEPDILEIMTSSRRKIGGKECMLILQLLPWIMYHSTQNQV